MTPPVLHDAAARQRIRDDLGTTLVVEAAAGTGKTTELVARIVALLSAGEARLDRLVAVTFTEKAAGEMKLRVRAEIERARSAPGISAESLAHLDEALSQLEVASIGTIHAFCAEVLKERPVEAGVDPLFEVMSDDRAQRTFDEAFEGWFQRALADPPEGVRRLLRRRPARRDAPGPRRTLRDAAWSLADHRDFDGAWRRDPLARGPVLDALVEQLAALAALAPRASWQDGWFTQSLQELGRWIDELHRREEVRGRDHDGLEAALVTVRRMKIWKRGLGRSAWFGDGLASVDVLAQRDAAGRALEDALDRSGADLAVCLREELRPVIAAYEDLKKRAGTLDFLDLLLRTRDLLRDDAAVRAEMQERFTHLFVDEFQDTDPLQAEILMLLAADDPAETDWRQSRPVPGKLFVVGDPKQSIYRFRRADVALYEDTKARLVAAGAEVLYLTTSFRGAPSIQAAVNATFAPLMQGGGSQARYVPLEPFRSDPEGRPALVALPVPRPYGEFGTVVKWKIEESTPDAVGAFVDWLIGESGWTVSERQNAAAVPIEARHVCLLFKRFQSFGDDVTGGYVRALEARRIPHVLVGGRSFHQREEVQAIRNALCAIEWPDDEMSVFATLRGPFFALGDDSLLAFRHGVRTLHPLAPRAQELEEPLAEVAVALSILARLHHGRNRRPIADTLGRLLEETRAHGGLAIWPRGEQALANVLRVLDVARSFEAGGATSFRAFVDHLEAAAERSDAGEAPVVEEGTDGVRIMTVHKAKGLEFPVVILADPTAPRRPTNPSRHVDPSRQVWLEPLAHCTPPELLEHREEALARDDEESIRLAYVAATRARDLLVVPVVGDEELATDAWLEVLQPALYPSPERWRAPGPALGCPAFQDDSVLERPPRTERGATSSVAPGAHAPRAGTHEVVWWDPHVLDLGKDLDVGLRQKRLLEADASGVVSNEGQRQHEAWQAARKKTIAQGAIPSLRVTTVSRETHEILAAAGGPPIELLETQATRLGRPHGTRFGSLVHATLAAVALDAAEGEVRRVAAAQGRLMAASPEEVDAAAIAVSLALVHPVLRAAAMSPDCRREAPVLHRRDDGTLIEGVVDLAFQADGTWTVVDFKTDVELSGRRASYEAQVRLYVEAIAVATGAPVRGLLLAV